MSNDSQKGDRFEYWLKWIIYPYPFLMIAAYYIGWKTIFYISMVPILILLVLGIISNIKYGNWKLAVLTLLTWLIFSEIGYLLTSSITDGICMGCYIALIIGTIQSLYNKRREQKQNKQVQ